MQPDLVATQPSSTVAIESKLVAVASVHPLTEKVQPPSSVFAIAR